MELGRRDEHVGHSVAAVLEREQSLLHSVAGDRLHDSLQFERAQALLHGLRSATTRYCDPMDIDAARELLGEAL